MGVTKLKPNKHIFLGMNYIVISLVSLIIAIDRIWKKLISIEHKESFTTGHLLISLLDYIAQDFLSIYHRKVNDLNSIEDHLFKNPRPQLLEKIFSLKRDLLHLRTIIGPQREVLNKLFRGETDLIDDQSKGYFRDVYTNLLYCGILRDEFLSNNRKKGILNNSVGI